MMSDRQLLFSPITVRPYKKLNFAGNQELVMTGYSIEGNGHTVHVAGTVKQDREVIVNYDGEQYVFNTSNGDLHTGVTSAEIIRSDGSYVKEGPVSQVIRLPNGASIEKSAVTEELRTPDGNVVENGPEDGNEANVVVDDGSIKISVQSNSSISHSSSSSNTNVEMSEGNTEEETKWKVSKEKLITSLVPGFWTVMLTVLGLIGQSQLFLLLGVSIYLVFAVPTLFRFVLERIILTEENEQQELQDDSGVDDIKQQYREGEINEEELEEMIEEEMVEDKEKSLNVEKV